MLFCSEFSVRPSPAAPIYVFPPNPVIRRLRASRVLLVGLRGLGAEVAKNLILAGVRALTMLDHHQVGAFWGEKQGNRGLWGHLNQLLGKKNVFLGGERSSFGAPEGENVQFWGI